MIVVRLKGGLGNQMFQFAYGYSQALRLNTSLILDHTFLENYPDDGTYTKRNYSLDNFKIDELKSDLKFPGGIGIKIKFFHDLNSKAYRTLNNLEYVKEDLEDPKMDYGNISNNTYCSGFWQNPAYFQNFESNLKEAFVIKDHKTQGLDLDLQKEIESCQSVSLHIRGGDYLNLENKSRFGAVGEEYFKKAIETKQQIVSNPKYFIFSNDINYAETIVERLDIDYHLVKSEGKNAVIHDMILMQSCHHNIITNSSFSWWAAYLNQNEEKEVFAPKKWFSDQPKRSAQIIPNKWLRL